MSHAHDRLTLESLLEYEPFVRRVLRNMLVGEDEIGDMVQETWLRALQNPPERRKGVRGWLASVARNLALDQRRRRANRRAREAQVARPEVEESAASDVRERLELHQKVVEAVLEMKEPYRSVVLLHYFDGLNLQQVAARLGRNESTVRTQLHRAHQRLFGRLDSNFGDRATWTAICLPWIFAKEGVLLPPASPLSAAPKAARAASRSKAGLWTTLGVTAVGIAGWQVWARNTGTVAAPLHGDGAAPAVAMATGPQDGSDLQAPGEEARVATIAEPVAGATQPVLDVLVTHDGRPAPDTDVWVFSPVLRDASGYASGSAVLDLNWLTRYPYFAMELSLRNNPPRKTDAEGRARIPLPSTWVLVFASNPAGFARVPLQGAFERAGEASPFEVKLENDPEAFVQVADPRGSPLPGIPIEVLADDGAGGWIALGALDSAEPDGHLRFGGFRTIQPAARYGLRAQIPGRINEIHPLETNPVQIAVHPVGRIEWSWPHDGESTASPTGIAYLTALDSTGTPVGETAAKRFAGFRGTFPAVEPGRQFELRLEAVEPGRTLIWTGAGPAVPGATERVQFREQGGTQIRGRLAGAMPPGAAQTQLPRYPFQFQLLDDAGHLVHEIRFLPDAEHAFHIALPLESDWPQPLHAEILSNWATGGTNHRARLPLPNLPWGAQTIIDLGELNLRWVPHSILGTVFDETGNPLAGVTVTAQTDRAGAMVEAQSDANGAYMLDGTWQAPVQVRLAPRSGRYLAEPAWWHGDQTPVPLPTYPAGSITGRIPGPSPAAPTSVRCIRIDADPSPAHLTPGQALPPAPVDSTTGTFRFDDVIPGLWRLEPDGDTWSPIEVLVPATGTAQVELTPAR